MNSPYVYDGKRWRGYDAADDGVPPARLYKPGGSNLTSVPVGLTFDVTPTVVAEETTFGEPAVVQVSLNPRAAEGIVLLATSDGSIKDYRRVVDGQAELMVRSSGSYKVMFWGDQNYNDVDSSVRAFKIYQSNATYFTKIADWVASYDENGDRIRITGWDQGYLSDPPGNRRSLIKVPWATAAKVERVTRIELSFTVSSTHYQTGADFDWGWHSVSDTSAPASYVPIAENEGLFSTRHGVGSQTVDLTDVFTPLITRPDFGGIVIGSAESNNLDHVASGSTSMSMKVSYNYWA